MKSHILIIVLVIGLMFSLTCKQAIRSYSADVHLRKRK